MFDAENAVERKASVFALDIWEDHIQDENGDMIPVEWINWQKVGNPNHCGTEKVKRIKKNAALWAALEPYYKAWKDNKEAPVDGHPIDNWPPISKGLAKVAKNNGIHTVEQLAEINDADLARLGMGSIGVREKAKAFIDLKNGDAKTAAIMARLKEMEETHKELIETNENLRAQLPKKRGPKPKKD